MTFRKPILFTLMTAALAACVSAPPPIEKAPASESAQLNLRLGAGYLQQGHMETAQEKFEKALEYDDSLPEAHNAIAVLYEETGRPALAERHYGRAVELQPSYALARMNYGRVLCENGKLEDGEAQYLKAASIDGGSPAEAYTGAAICALEIPDKEKAREYLNKAMAAGPSAPRALYQMADMSYAEGDYAQAKSYLSRYHARAGFSPQSLWLAMSIEQALGDEAARQVYADILLSRFGESNEARQFRSQ